MGSSKCMDNHTQIFKGAVKATNMHYSFSLSRSCIFLCDMAPCKTRRLLLYIAELYMKLLLSSPVKVYSASFVRYLKWVKPIEF